MVFTGFLGSILALLLNLYFTFPFAVPGLIILGLGYLGYMDTKWGYYWLGLWVIGNAIFMFALGGFVSWSKKVANEPHEERPDINPYSPKNEDYFPKGKNKSSNE